jgi:hypothetical protein
MGSLEEFESIETPLRTTNRHLRSFNRMAALQGQLNSAALLIGSHDDRFRMEGYVHIASWKNQPRASRMTSVSRINRPQTFEDVKGNIHTL